MLPFTINTVTNILPSAGKLLIAEPFMRDPEFSRAVIYICNHDEDGTFGLAINKQLEQTLDCLLPDLTAVPWPIYIGGPVDEQTLFILHTLPELLGGEYVSNGIYLGADFELLKIALLTETLDAQKVKFFLGYSGWSSGQLDNELKEEAWLVATADKNVVMSHQQNDIYKKSLEPLGKSFSSIALLPKHPSLN
jgi:putative transcriptional regulator